MGKSRKPGAKPRPSGEEEFRRWARRDPASKVARCRVWVPPDTTLNETNQPLKPPVTEYDDVGDGMQEGLKGKDR